MAGVEVGWEGTGLEEGSKAGLEAAVEQADSVLGLAGAEAAEAEKG